MGEICWHKSNDSVVLKADAFYDTVYKMNMDTMGYEVKDVYELLKYLFKVIHNQFKTILKMTDEL